MQSNRQPNWLRAGSPRIRENISKTFALGKNSHRAENLVKHVQKRRICKNLVNNDQNATDQDFATFDQNIMKTHPHRDPANEPSTRKRRDGTDTRQKPLDHVQCRVKQFNHRYLLYNEPVFYRTLYMMIA